jgi:hypothetical protein
MFLSFEKSRSKAKPFIFDINRREKYKEIKANLLK